MNDRWRWCVYCGADCWPEPENQRHAQECPVTTGLYTIGPDDEDPWIKGTYGGCCSCGTVFQLGDHYVLIDSDTGKPATSPECSETTCVGCAALAMVAP